MGPVHSNIAGLYNNSGNNNKSCNVHQQNPYF